jgi:hypothetical protein
MLYTVRLSESNFQRSPTIGAGQGRHAILWFLQEKVLNLDFILLMQILDSGYH